MENKKRQIISYLRKNAKNSLASISYEINMPISTVYDNINRFQKNKIIKKTVALIDFKKVGYHHNAKIILQVPRSQKSCLQDFLVTHLAINSIYEINDGFMVETVHKDIKEYLEFIESLKESFDIIEKQEYQIINEIAREKFV